MPHDSDVKWQPPQTDLQRIDEDTRDLIVAFSNKASSTEIASLLSSKQNIAGRAIHIDKRRVGCIVTSMKRRRKEKDYHYQDTIHSHEDEARMTSAAASDDEDFPEDGAIGDLEISPNKVAGSNLQVNLAAAAKLMDTHPQVLNLPGYLRHTNPSSLVGGVSVNTTVTSGHIGLTQNSLLMPGIDVASLQRMQRPVEVPCPNKTISVSQLSLYQGLTSNASMLPISEAELDVDLPQKITSHDIPNLGDIGALLQVTCQQND